MFYPFHSLLFSASSVDMDIDLCYLLLVPLQPHTVRGPLEAVTTPKDAPYFFDLDIEFRSAGESDRVVEGVPVRVRRQVLDETVWLAECRYRLTDAFGETALARKVAVQTALRQDLLQDAGYAGLLVEEYTVLLTRVTEPTPDEFVDAYAPALARLLRSDTEPVKEVDTSEMLGARARYSSHDLTVVDWVGGLIIAKDGDFQSDIELMKIGNYQILRYRLLDETMDQSLQRLRANLERARLRWIPASNAILQNIVEQRLSLLLDFQKIDQSLLLIGDWYSARVYGLIVAQFYLDEWKAAVSAKLDSLSEIDGIVRENLTFSWRRVLDTLQLAGWMLMLLGYFVLFVLDLRARK
jgi:hypothetical protein